MEHGFFFDDIRASFDGLCANDDRKMGFLERYLL